MKKLKFEKSVFYPTTGYVKKYQNPPPQKKKCAKDAAKGFCHPSRAIWGEFGFFSFPKLYPPGEVNPKKYFEVTHRAHGVANP